MEAFGYAFGVAHTDGSVFVSTFRGKAYRAKGEPAFNPDGTPKTRLYTQHRISLQCGSGEFARRFQSALTELTGKTPSIRSISRTFNKTTLRGVVSGHQFHGFQVKMANKPLVEEFMRLNVLIAMGQFTEVWAMADDRLQAMLAGIVDADGYVAADGIIVIRQKEPAFIGHLCNRLGIQASIYDYAHQSAPQINIPKRHAIHIDTFKRSKK